MVYFVACDFLTTICHLAIVNVCVIIILSIGNTQISIPLLGFLYLFVELMITMNEYLFFLTKRVHTSFALNALAHLITTKKGTIRGMDSQC